MQRILILFILLGLISCNGERKVPSKPVVAVSILPQKYIITSIADTLLDVVVMVPPGASPATWEATPEQMKSLSYAQAYFRVGHIGFEKAWMDRISELNKQMEVIDLSEDLDLISIQYRHGDHSHTGTDPHTWMSADRMEQMARTSYINLVRLFPEYKKQFQINYEILISEIKSVGSIMSGQLSEYKGNNFLIFHPSLGYLAKDFGLHQHSIEFEGKEPSPGHLREIIDLARKNEIKLIFVQEEFDQRNAVVIAKEIGGSILIINPLAEDWPSEMKTISNHLKRVFE
jgi:zinc transport system substrate-binding protein